MRNTKLCVYGSSYDRGLEHLLKIWPDVKKEVSDAELHIFYGWDLFARFYHDNAERMAWMEKMNTMMKAEGITHLERISHEAIVKEMENAGVWAYPTHFGEINCITAIKAQAYGAWPVVVNYAALKETVKYGDRIEGDIYDEETREKYKKALIKRLVSPPDDAERLKMQKWAKDTYGWDKVAKQWSETFGEISLDRRVNELMEDNQALKAWELVKDTDYEKKDILWERVRHAFEPEVYKKYYEESLIEEPVSEEIALDCTKLAPRFAIMVPKIVDRKPKTVLDLGCADGYLCLTLAKHGIKTTGINLYNPSVKIANERANKHKIDASFYQGDIFECKKKADVVVMMEVLEHLPDPQKGVDHAMSLLNKDGYAYFSTPRTDHIGVEMHKNEQGKRNWWDDVEPAGHLRLFTEEEFKKLFDKYTLVDFVVDNDRCMLAEVRV